MLLREEHYITKDGWPVAPATTLPATIPSTVPHGSITVVPTLERAFNLDIKINSLFLSKDGELLTECRKCNSDTVSSRSFGRGRHRNQHDHTVANGEDETIS